MNDKAVSYTTHQELEFIESLGMYSGANYGRKSLLKGYIKAAKIRDDWGGIDKGKVINHAVFCLSKLV